MRVDPTLVWGGAIGLLAAYDVWCAYNKVQGDSLSEVARVLFRTHTPCGRRVFQVLLGLGSAWLMVHIVAVVEEIEEHIEEGLV